MFSAILAIMLLPVTDLGRYKGLQFRPLSKIAFWLFVANFLVLMQLGAKHVVGIAYTIYRIWTNKYYSILHSFCINSSFGKSARKYFSRFKYF